MLDCLFMCLFQSGCPPLVTNAVIDIQNKLDEHVVAKCTEIVRCQFLLVHVLTFRFGLSCLKPFKEHLHFLVVSFPYVVELGFRL